MSFHCMPYHLPSHMSTGAIGSGFSKGKTREEWDVGDGVVHLCINSKAPCSAVSIKYQTSKSEAVREVAPWLILKDLQLLCSCGSQHRLFRNSKLNSRAHLHGLWSSKLGVCSCILNSVFPQLLFFLGSSPGPSLELLYHLTLSVSFGNQMCEVPPSLFPTYQTTLRIPFFFQGSALCPFKVNPTGRGAGGRQSQSVSELGRVEKRQKWLREEEVQQLNECCEV
jgi:hypothetical protein